MNGGVDLPPMSGDLRAILSLVELLSHPDQVRARIKELHEAQAKNEATLAEINVKARDADEKWKKATALAESSEKKVSEMLEEMRKLRSEMAARQVQVDARERAARDREAELGQEQSGIVKLKAQLVEREVLVSEKEKKASEREKQLEERAEALQRATQEIEVKREQVRRLATTLGG